MPTDKFDCNKAAEVEGVTDANFAAWKSGKQSEVKRLINSCTCKFSLQVATFVTGALAAPGRTMMMMAIDAYVHSGDTPRQIAEVRPSANNRGLNLDKKTEILKQLRTQFENGRKMFNFALVNASMYTFSSSSSKNSMVN